MSEELGSGPDDEGGPKSGEIEVTSYKGFDKNLMCRDQQYAIGATYEMDGRPEACKRGFHACEYPLDIFAYYPPAASRYGAVRQSGAMDRHEEDTKIASTRITIEAELHIPCLVEKAIAWITAKLSPAKTDHATGYRSRSSATGNSSASAATGNSSASAATGDSSASSATGNRSASSATGDSSASSATGYRSASSATGDRSASSATGDSSASSATGYRSASSATGNSSASAATGNSSASAATGDSSASSATGNSSASSATGDSSASSATGYRSASSVEGTGAVAMSIGEASKSRAGKDGAIVCVYRDEKRRLVHIRAAMVGGPEAIKPDTWYTLDVDGDFEEVGE